MKKVIIISLVGALVIGLAKKAKGQEETYDLTIYFPQTPQEFIEEGVIDKITPEIKKYVGALAGIMILHQLIKK